VVALLELKFWYLPKPVQLADGFLVFYRDLEAFFVVKIEGGGVEAIISDVFRRFRWVQYAKEPLCA
jgi:hypothetical protein